MSNGVLEIPQRFIAQSFVGPIDVSYTVPPLCSGLLMAVYGVGAALSDTGFGQLTIGLNDVTLAFASLSDDVLPQQVLAEVYYPGLQLVAGDVLAAISATAGVQWSVVMYGTLSGQTFS